MKELYRTKSKRNSSKVQAAIFEESELIFFAFPFSIIPLKKNSEDLKNGIE